MHPKLIKLAAVTILACLTAVPHAVNAASTRMPVRATAPAAVAVPADIARFLEDLGNAYGSADSAQVADFLSSGFLHQGMDREVFLKHLKSQQKYLGKLAITPVSFTADGDKATVVAYAVAPLGPLAPSLQALPLHAGATLIRQDGGWKLHGNQQQKEVGLYKEGSAISADFPPADLEAYKRHIPAGYSMPEKPTVRIAIINWSRIEAPQTPYWLAHLNILVSRNGALFWHLLAMPETDWLAVEAGKTIGFPKFVADFEVQRTAGNQWQAGISLAGISLINASYEPDPAARAVYQPDENYATLFFGKDGNPVFERVTALGVPTRFQQGYGWITVNAQEPLWRELVKPGTRAAATSLDFEGEFKLKITTQ